jgi:transposase
MSASSSFELSHDADVLRKIVIDLRSTLDEQADRIAQLEEWVRLLRSQRFGRSSEKSSSDQLGLFNEAEQSVDAAELEPAAAVQDEIEVPAHRRQRPGRRPLPEWMERVEIVHDLPEDTASR